MKMVLPDVAAGGSPLAGGNSETPKGVMRMKVHIPEAKDFV